MSTDASTTTLDVDSDAPSSYSTASSPAAAPTAAVVDTSAATGRRKEAVARVRITPGSGSVTINGRSLEAYFPNKVHQQTVLSPLVALGVADQVDVVARVHGGGTSGQAGALRHGLARALSSLDTETNRSTLKKAGFLTRDPRAKERRKAGLKKARKAPQYSKR